MFNFLNLKNKKNVKTETLEYQKNTYFNKKKQNLVFLKRKNKQRQDDKNFRIIKPSESFLAKERLRNKIRQKTLLKIPNWFFLDFNFFKKKKLEKINYTLLSEKLFLNLQLISKINNILLTLIILLILSFVFYLGYFDNYFLIKNYNVFFSENSYLNSEDTDILLQTFNKDKSVFGLSNNQYWFINTDNITNISKNYFPYISKIEIIKRTWPNTVDIRITTSPLLATIAIKEDDQIKYWRISEEGFVMTQDKNNLKEELIQINRSISFNKSKLTFKDYDISKNKILINRLWMVKFLKEIFLKNNLTNFSVIFPSISDTDVIFKINNTKFVFESNTDFLAKEITQLRLETFFKSQLIEDFRQKKINYLDFRIPNGKIYVCNINSQCSNKSF